MTNPLEYLPVEILTVIADQFLLRDHCNCSNVNRQWYSFFRRYLYKSISLTTEKRFNTFLSYYHHPGIEQDEKELGQWVREVHCNDNILYSDYYSWQKQQQLFNFCPSINALHLILTDDRIQSQHQPKLWASSLYHLTLAYTQEQQVIDSNSNGDHDSGAHDNFDDEDEDDDYYDEYYDQEDYYYHRPMSSLTRQSRHSLFACLPSNLRSLALDKIFRALRVDHLEMIHQACPTLTDLYLTVGILCHHSLENGHVFHQHNYYDMPALHQQHQQQISVTNHSNVLKSERSQLQRLSITTPKHYGYDAIMTSGWLQYLLLAYPNLDRLKLGHIKTVSPKKNNKIHVVDDVYYEVVLTKYGFLLDHLKVVQTSLVRFISCWRSRIFSRTSGMTEMPHDFHRRQQHSTSRTGIYDILLDVPINIFDFRLTFDHHDNLHNQPSNIIQLELACNDNKQQGDFPHTLNIDMLLTHLPFLRRFHAEAISLERGQRNRQLHPLREIKLKKSWVCDSALDSVTQQCPSLNELVLLDCNILLMMRKTFQLSMPHHVMQSIVLEGVSLIDYFGDDDPIRLVQLLTIDELPRLFMAHRCNQQERELLEKNTNIVMDTNNYNSDSIIHCQSLHQLVVK